ncbi:hypothetical protein GYH30_016794 [Glycine max]|nr:hypothetical protein GYH30_016794 [Glycine max]
MLKGYAKNSSLGEALFFFYRMMCDGVRPVVGDYACLLQLCGENLDLKRGREIHGQIITNGFKSNLFAITAVMNLYAKCREIDDAYKMFKRMPQKDLRALQLVFQMQQAGQKPDSVTLVSILPAVADMKPLRIGRSIHGYAFRSGFESPVNVTNALLDMHFKYGHTRTARLVFEGMSSKSVVSRNTMIDGCAQNDVDEGEVPTRVTMMGALLACANLGDLERGRFVHKLPDKLKLDSNVSVMNSLISMYSKCKRVDIAASIFDNLKEKTNATRNAMILRYAQNGCVKEALNLFCIMQSQGIKLDCFTLVGVITALADFSVNRHAKWIHGLAIRTCMDKNVFVSTALVDMYARCGAIKTARKLFDMMQERHVITWNAMLDGYGTHGLGKEALDLFNEMPKEAVKPNDITFFAMVDLLGGAGQLDCTWNFIQDMPIKPGISVLGAMLGACKIHKNVELGEKAADKLFELDPNEGGYHVLLANIYASNSTWDKVAKLRKEVHTFYSRSTNHPQSKRIYAFLETLGDEIKAAGYVPHTNSIHDVEEDVKEQLLGSHSERLAIAFELLHTSPGMTLHIRKNLRVCVDCHDATKYISLVRYPHFKNGICSCGDYW